MGPGSYLSHIRTDGEALAAVGRAAPSAAVASCPEWDMTALLGHVGGVHRWVEQILATKAQDYVKRVTPVPDSQEAVLAWYGDGLGRLLATLGATDADEMVWNWRDRVPAPAGFWFRRMAHETAVHRWDGEAAAGAPQPVATDMAVDGIDEYLSFVGLWLARTPVAGLTGSVHLHATDTEGEWSLQLAPDRLEYSRAHAKADAAVRGHASDLLLWMYNRLPAEAPSLQLFGDPAVLARWRQLKF